MNSLRAAKMGKHSKRPQSVVLYMITLLILVLFVLIIVIHNSARMVELYQIKNKIITHFVNSLPDNSSMKTLLPIPAVASKAGLSIVETIREAYTSKTIQLAKSSTQLDPIRQDSCDNCFKHDFNLVINSDAICTLEPGGSIDLLVLISTEHSHVNQRHAIRNSWMQTAKNNTSRVRYAFTLGQVDNEQLQKAVLEESKQYKDILKEDFVDAYNNLTLKTLMGIKWAALHCPDAKYVLKTDDDMWVNIKGLLKLLEKRADEIKTVVGGRCFEAASPIRDELSKWYASERSYPYDKYPGYCSGTGYVASNYVVKQLYEISPSVPFFHLEDIYIALCMNKLGLKLTSMPGFHSGRPDLSWCDYKADDVITIHRVPPNDLLKIWREKC